MGILLKVRLLSWKNALWRMTAMDAAKTLGFGALGAVFLQLLYWGAIRLMWELKNVPVVGDLLLQKITAMAFLATFSMIALSSLLTSFSTLFLARDLAFLLHSPLPTGRLFLYKAGETTLYASWMVAAALAPLIGALGHVHEAGPLFYAASAALFPPFAAAAGAAGIGLALFLMVFFPARRVREMTLFLAIVIGCGLFVLVRWLGPEKLVHADAFEQVVEYMSLLQAPTAPYVPSWWMAKAVTALAQGKPAAAAAPAAALLAAAAALTAALTGAARWLYARGWSAAQESPRRQVQRPLGTEWRWVPPLFTRRVRALLGKDVLTFFRDAGQWSQGLLLLSLTAVYLISLHKLPLDSPFIKGLVSFLNIGMAGFVLSSVALRFVFPSISLEGKSWWVLRAAPQGLWGVLAAKWLWGFLPLGLLGAVLAVLSNRLLGADPFVARLGAATLTVMAAAFSGMAVGFGALFPRFQVENVARIETSPGGLLYMICALFYLAATLALEALLVRAHHWAALGRGPALLQTGLGPPVLAALVLLNAIAVVPPLALGKAHLERADL